MTIDEIITRILRGHLLTILACLLVPTLVTAWVTSQHPKEWSASVRIQVLPDAPISQTEAEGRSSRFLALATTPSLVSDALDAIGSNADAEEVARESISAERLGESSVVELHVRAEEAGTARNLATALAERIVEFMNAGQADRYEAIITGIDERIERANQQRNTLSSQLARTRDLIVREDLRLRLNALSQELDQLSEQRTALVQADLERDEALVIDGQTPHVEEVPSTLLPRSALAALFGLIAGITVAVTVETLRPRIAGVRALARRLGAPVLGHTTGPTAELAGTLRLAGRRQGVETLVLVGVDDRDGRRARSLLGELTNHSEVSRDNPLVGSMMRARQRLRGEGDTLTDPTEEPNGSIRFAGLSEVPKSAEHTAGVVVVSSGHVLERELDELSDVLQATRWPVVGVVAVSARRRWWWPR